MNKRADALTDIGINTEIQENIKKRKSKNSVYIYIAALFLIVLLFILLSYFIQQRNNSELHMLNEQNATAQQHIENLQNTNLQLQAENDINTNKLSELETQISDMEDQIKAVRLAWQSDVQNVKKNDTAQYDALLAKYNELIEKYEVEGNKK